MAVNSKFIFGALLGVAVVGGYFFVFHNTPKAKVETGAIDIPKKTSEVSDNWKTYINNVAGFFFRLP